MKGILGRKVGMTQLFDEQGNVVPVTVIQAGPCYVTQIKTKETDGYNAVQIGFEEVPERKLTRGELGHLKRANVPPLRHLQEIRLGDQEEPPWTLGQQIRADIFSEGERVDVIGRSKGRGFAGAVKRHGFRGGPKTHGQSDRWRAPGSRGAGTTPGHTFPGTKGPGRMGNKRVTVLNLEVVLVDPERNLLAVKGAVPGPRTGLVFIRSARKGPRKYKARG